MAILTTFPQFAALPPELRVKIWEESLFGPSMHIFDVCFPSWRGNERSKRAFSRSDGSMTEENSLRYQKYKDSVFLDALEVDSQELSRTTRIARHRFDPSMYQHRERLQLTNTESCCTLKTPDDIDENTVYLPGRNRKIQYNNSTDTLFLRFRDGGAVTGLSQTLIFGPEPRPSSIGSLGQVLEESWSPEIAQTLGGARRIALDVAETWSTTTVGDVLLMEIGYLASCLQEGLEVLYLVDHCPGRCGRCKRDRLQGADMSTRRALSATLHGEEREEVERDPDVIHGIGKKYTEVLDLEALGWEDCHPTFIFAIIMDHAIRSQQRDCKGEISFKGIRVLVVEDEFVGNIDTTMVADCDPVDVLDFPNGKAWGISEGEGPFRL
jgi:hypothetical protein